MSTGLEALCSALLRAAGGLPPQQVVDLVIRILTRAEVNWQEQDPPHVLSYKMGSLKKLHVFSMEF